MRNLYTLGAYIAQNERWNTSVLSNDMQWSCHVRHYTCTQNVAIDSLSYIQEF